MSDSGLWLAIPEVKSIQEYLSIYIIHYTISVNINKYNYLSAATLIQLDIHKAGEHREPGALGPHDEGCFSE